MTSASRIDGLIRFVLLVGATSAIFVVVEDFLETPELGTRLVTAGSGRGAPPASTAEVPPVPTNTTAPGSNETRGGGAPPACVSEGPFTRARC